MSSDLCNLLSPAAVRFQAVIRDKQAAITAAGELLVNAGYVDSKYIAEMLKREEIISTYIGNGVAIPHGTEESRDLVNKTGLSLIQVPQGVNFNGETARIIIGIAAKDDSHLQILANLAEILCDSETVEKLINAASYEEVFKLLTMPAAS